MNGAAYYNDNDAFCAVWLRALMGAGVIPKGTVDDRPIQEVRPEDLAGITQCHFFAGTGAWSMALRAAGWPDAREAWTGSCPCQPFSCAGRRMGASDERHLWPHFRNLIAQRRPPVVFGEQVASKDARLWLAGIRADLERVGYALGAADLCAAGVGAPHVRQRLYWLADRGVTECDGRSKSRLAAGLQLHASNGRNGGGLDDANGPRPQSERQGPEGQARDQAWLRGPQCGCSRFWSDAIWHACRDGKCRRISPEPELFPLAYGIPVKAEPLRPRLEMLGVEPAVARRIIALARKHRVGGLRGYGNAIVLPLAAEFISASMEVLSPA